MIASKKINIITITLVIIVIAAIAAACFFNTGNNSGTGVRVYAEGDEAVFEADDFYTEAASGVTKINLDAPTKSANVTVDNGITIMSGGTYVLSGSYNGTLYIDTENSGTVRLVLNGAALTSENMPAIYVKNAEKTVISTVKGTENHISDSGERLDEELNATVYSKDALTFNGKGVLNITGNYADAVKCNDELKITGGEIIITAVDDAINANDYVVTDGGTITIDAKGDGIKSGNDEVKGFIAIDGGSIDIQSGDDALHAEGTLYVNNGNINIDKCVEGFEGYAVVINGGNHSIVSSDDAINAAADGSGDMRNERNHTETVLTVNGGKLYIDAGGDGFDSNGATVINGGEIELYGPENNGNSALDFDSSFAINGGILTITGSSGMAEPPSDSSTQNSIVVATDTTYDANSTISLNDADGNVVVEFTSPKRFNWICISTPDIKTGNTYSLNINGEEVQSLEITSVITNAGNGGFGMGGFGGGRFGGMMQRPDGEMPQMPDGERPQMPDGERPQIPDGERPQRPDGEMPQRPGSGMTGRQMPNGEMQQRPDGEMPQMPNRKNKNTTN